VYPSIANWHAKAPLRAEFQMHGDLGVPGFVERVAARCPGLPDGVLALLVDGRTCLDHGLLRPAVVLMGVAYESAVEAFADSLVAKKLLPDQVVAMKAAARIGKVKAMIDELVPATTPMERDRRFATHAAYDFADALRRRRNDASHTAPSYGFDDREEIEELLISAGRHLPALWSVHVD